MVDIGNCFLALSKASPNNVRPPKGGGGSFPGETNALTTSVPLVSARWGKRISSH